MSIVVEKTYTPEDLLAMPNRKDYELVDGQFVKRHTSVRSSWVGGQISCQLSTFLDENPLGWVWPADQGYVCFPASPVTVRKPDVSFVRKERLPEGPNSEPYIDIPPDLAVEVISPNESAYEVENKVVEYLNAGVSLVWVINPEARTVHIHRGDGTVGWLREEDELSGEHVVVGFRCRVTVLFPTKSSESLAAG